MSRMALSSDALVIVSLAPKDWSAVRAIYLEGIATGNSTFEKSAPDWDTWDRDHLPTCRLSARCGDETVGWAALSPVSRRTVYAGVAEVSVYVAARARGQGVGMALLSAIVKASERAGIWALQGGRLSREHRESRLVPEGRVSSCGNAEADWLHGWPVAWSGASRTEQPHRRRV